jgi:hypothetical protein
MSDKNVSPEVQVTGTRRAGEKFPEFILWYLLSKSSQTSNDNARPQVTLKVRIDPAWGDEHSNLTKIKMDMLEDLRGQAAQYLHTLCLLDKLVFTKQGITGETDCLKCLRIFESLLGPKTKSTFASLLGRAVEKSLSKRVG